MFDSRLRPVVDPILDRVGQHLVALGFRADIVTLAGFAICIPSIAAIALEAHGIALALILLNRIMDGLDGAIARQTGITDRGGFLDITCDFIFYASVPFAFALAAPADNGLPAAFLIFSFVGTGASFLAYASIAARRGLTSVIRGQKSLYYLGGLTEGAETIAFFALLCLLPDWFPKLAYGFGALCWMTTAARMVAGWRAFR